MKRILVTGATGFAGSYIACFLKASGYDVYGLTRQKNSADKSFFPMICQDLAVPLSVDMDFDAIVHTAAAHPGCPITQLKRDNIDTMQNIIDFSREHSVSKIIFLSSVSVYGTIKTDVINEETDIINPDAYGLSKRIAELLLLEQSQIEGVCLRLPGLFGVNAKHSWLVETVYKICTGQDITIYSPDFLTNNFVYIKDLAKYVHILLSNNNAPRVCLLGAKQKISILDLVLAVKERAQSPSKIHIGKTIKSPFSLDIQKAISYGYHSVSPLEMISDYFACMNSNGMEAKNHGV